MTDSAGDTVDLTGETAVVTGAGRGLGRAHAIELARRGARVVVNDLADDDRVADAVVEEIRAAGGTAIANGDDVATSGGAARLMRATVGAFGGLNVVVNNAGILRDRPIVNMSTQEWDDVQRVHLRGHFCVTREAARYWRDESKAGRTTRAAVVNTTSTSGLFGQYGQANYAAAKAGIAALTTVAQVELGRYGVAVNAVAPAARTRLTDQGGLPAAPPEQFDIWDPSNVSAVVAYLASSACRLRGRILFAVGGDVHLMEPWRTCESVSIPRRWDAAELAAAIDGWADLAVPSAPALPGQP